MRNSPDHDGSRRTFLRNTMSWCASLTPGTWLPKFVSRTWSSIGIGNQNGEKERMNGALSAAALRHMHDVMSGYVKRGEVPGLITVVSLRAEASVDALGTKSIGGADSRPVRRDMIFRIASMTKPITAIATMILVEESKLHLDEPVDKLLPELANRKVLKRIDSPLDDTVPARRPITVRRSADVSAGLGSPARPTGQPSHCESDIRTASRCDSLSRADAASARRVDAAPGNSSADVSTG